jgi:hypothetical protein
MYGRLTLSVWYLAAPPVAAPSVPNPAPAAPPGLDRTANLFLSWLKWGGIVAGVAGMMICGIMMAVGRRNRHALAADGAAGLPWVLGGLSIVVLAAGLVGAVLA